MPSKNMIRKGKRRHSVKAEYRLHRDTVREQAALSEAAQGSTAAPASAVAPEFQPAAPSRVSDGDSVPASPGPDIHSPGGFTASSEVRGKRLDVYLSGLLTDLSRSRVQLLINAAQVLVDSKAVPPSTVLRGGERIEILGETAPPPLHGEPEEIPLTVVYEDDDLAVINKPAGMMVHAGSGSPEHNRGTLVNALLFHFGKQLSSVNGDLRPGIVHRLDKDTSGLILVAKNDQAHRHLSAQFSARTLHKSYLALVQGHVAAESGTVDLPISRDLVRRTRMTARRASGRSAVTHWRVLERLQTAYGRFSLLELQIETGRTHQIRVHMQSLGHPVVGDTTYGAAEHLRPAEGTATAGLESIRLGRNFLHAAALQVLHPLSNSVLSLSAPLPSELQEFLTTLRGSVE